MGLILDTSVIVAAERRGHSIPKILAQVLTALGETEVGVSVVTAMELAHGIQRAKTTEQRQRRQAFVNEVLATLTIHPVSLEIALRAGAIAGQEATRGVTIPIEDLLIATTALQIGFQVATHNVRHFEAVPGLIVVQV